MFFIIIFSGIALCSAQLQTMQDDYLAQIKESIQNKMPPYILSGHDLAWQHLTDEHARGLRPAPVAGMLCHEGPIAQNQLDRFWVSGEALCALCIQHDIGRISRQQLTPLIPVLLAVKIGHPQGNNCWFLLGHVSAIIAKLGITDRAHEAMTKDPFE